MSLAIHPGRHSSNTGIPASRTTRSKGCWTCRLRRKKCDEKHPVCDICAALFITCHYNQTKPDWMDGGRLQEEMADKLKCEVRESAALRRAAHSSVGSEPQDSGPVEDELAFDKATPEIHSSQPQTAKARPQRRHDCSQSGKYALDGVAFGRPDTVLLMFYLEHLFPFLFPFYQPSILEGGRAWVLEMMISSPVVRQAILCQSSYFFSLVRGIQDGDMIWETMLTQSGEAFGVLRQSLQLIEGSDVTEHIHGAVRIISGILQVQRFEVAVLGFDNCKAHLNAARALFKQLLDCPGEAQVGGPSANFNAVVCRLGPPSWIQPGPIPISSAEQAAFRFSSALLILDDIIASTVLQEKPTLFEYHESLLGDSHGAGASIDLEAVVGCQNWVLRHIGEIAVLDAWKKQSKNAGTLNVMDLVGRATNIKSSLEAHLQRLETERVISPNAEKRSLLDLFATHHGQHTSTPTEQTSLTTRVWAHAALAYLFVVVSGWQPASADVRHHVGMILELLICETSPPELLRTMVWPFCVAGCLAGPMQEVRFRGMVDALQPPSVFGTVYKALGIMENVWRSRDTALAADYDLAACFASQGDLVLLV